MLYKQNKYTKKSKSVLQQLHVKEKVKLVTSFDSLPQNFQPVSIFPLFADSGRGGTSVSFTLPTNFEDS